MIYREFLVMRKAVLWYLGISVAIALIFWISSCYHQPSNHMAFNVPAKMAAFPTSIFAAIFGVALGNGSREGARVFWTMPTARWVAAFHVVMVDLIAITLAFFALIFVGWLYIVTLNLVHPVVVHGDLFNHWTLPLVGFLFAVYGWSALVGMIGRRIAYVGIASLPLLMVWQALARLDGVAGSILRAPLAANPYALLSAMSDIDNAIVNHQQINNPLAQALMWTAGWDGPMFFAVAVVCCAIAVVLWQRSQVLSV